MIQKELEQLYWLEKELKILNKKLKDLEYHMGIRRSRFTGLQASSAIRGEVSGYALERNELLELIGLKEKEVRILKEKSLAYIEAIEDPELCLIVKLRGIYQMSWERIGEEIGMDRRTASRKYSRLMEAAHNARIGCAIVKQEDGREV